MNDATYDTGAPEPEAGLSPAIPELSQLLIYLLKGVLYREEDGPLWASLLRLQTRIREQAAVMLLDLVVDEAEGYAFLKSRPDPDDSEGAPRLPRLVTRRSLSYPVSLMLALLRKRLAEFDAGGGDTRLVLSREEIAELMRMFLPDGTNEVRLVDQVDATISKVVDLGFLRRLKPGTGGGQMQGQDKGKNEGHYEVRRILKAFVDAQWLAEFDTRLETYRTALAGATAAVQARGTPDA
jgi:hypothetical protein